MAKIAAILRVFQHRPLSEPLCKLEISSEFVTLPPSHEGEPRTFIVSPMPGHTDVSDVLQKTNLVL